MQKINWNQFKLRNENYRQSFEDFCYFLFCRKFKITEGIRTDYNQVGLETEPIYDSKSKNFFFLISFNNLCNSGRFNVAAE